MIFELSERKRKIFEAVVDDYLDTATPVGSSTISRHYLRQLSPATVRNELAELERIGFVTHPHTSAGRIPTDIGYRYYVDYIMESKNISGREISLIKTGIRKIGYGLEDLLKGVARAISSMLDYAAVFVSFSKKRREVYSTGISNMLRQPEFQNIRHARQVFETVEHEEMLSDLFEEYIEQRPFEIKIGHENKIESMQDLSIVIAHYNLKDLDHGALGIIGPTRMNYGKVRSVLSYVSSELDQLMEEI